jgi:tripartite-type tricarboxylate transporter receptor subunit TctC
MGLLLRIVASSLSVLSLTAGVAGAQVYPSKPVRVVIPWPPGGGNDIADRIVMQKVSEALGQQFTIDNRGGAGGTIGSDVVAKAPASSEQGSRLRDANVREQGESAVG